MVQVTCFSRLIAYVHFVRVLKSQKWGLCGDSAVQTHGILNVCTTGRY
jgi:hypothetical protein